MEYGDKPNVKHVLIIYLGEFEGKIYGLDASKIPDNERNIIVDKAFEIQGMPMNMIMNWLKMFCPISYSTCYRTYKSELSKVINKYSLNIRA